MLEGPTKSPPKLAHEWAYRYHWLLNKEVFPPGIEFAGLMEVAEQERSLVFWGLDLWPKEHGLTRCVLVTKDGQKVEELEIRTERPPFVCNGPQVSLYCRGRFVGIIPFLELLNRSAYCLFYNPKDLALVLLLVLKN